jgi:predicted acetyltransferase
LSTRRYAVVVEVVLDVVDPVFGDGRFLLTGGPDGARCGHSDRAADITLGAAALGASYLGGTRLAGLANAGQVRSDDPAVLSRLDRALLADRAPFHGTGF